jgi:hypothetical protein
MFFRFRLTIASNRAGIFRFAQPSVVVPLPEGLTLEVVARNADTLSEASNLHFDGHGFEDESAARAAGERLRLRLRVLDAILGLGLHVPLTDTISGGASLAVKKEMAEQHGVTVLDNVWGLATSPDDGQHVEIVAAAEARVHPSDPSYLITGLQKLWDLDVQFNQNAEDALSILSLATRETSERAAFLTTFLALEALLPRERRSPAALDLLEALRTMVLSSSLSQSEQSSLLGALGSLSDESFRTVLMRLADRMTAPQQIAGKPVKDFLDECIRIRNAIAHKALLGPDVALGALTKTLREFVLALIWTFNRIPSISIDVPASQLAFPPGGFAFRVL